jgi:hypothetical protein
MARHGRSTARWLSRRGFALAVVGIAISSVWVAMAVSVPVDVPDFALRAAMVYRVEVGVAFFAALYLVATAIVLATHDRAFTEFGAAGVSARDLVSEQRKISLADLEKAVEGVRDLTRDEKADDDNQ